MADTSALKAAMSSGRSTQTLGSKIAEQGKLISKDFFQNKYVYLMAIPGILF